MRRPGPRPYECVRRAWHSDRHQPIRGSLIQEIFRVVNEVHSSATKKNKEWQEKLPIVVLKAEEILYSKADSEADYMDISTLWVRINEAINTIIRLDESTETGEYLHPCIEAALYLGCTPKRSSRTNRSCNLRCYLTSCTQKLKTIPPSTPDSKITLADCTSQHFSICPEFSKQTSNLANARSKCQNHTTNSVSTDQNIWPSINKQQFSLCSLYSCSTPAHGKHYPYIQILPKSFSTNLDSGDQNLYSSDAIPTKNLKESSRGNTFQGQSKTTCDLSLRLGPLSVPHHSTDNSRSRTTEDSDTDGPVVISMDQPLQLGRKFCFPPWGSALEPCSRERSFRVDI